MYLALKEALGSIALATSGKIVHLWNKFSRRWEVENRNWENLS